MQQAVTTHQEGCWVRDQCSFLPHNHNTSPQMQASSPSKKSTAHVAGSNHHRTRITSIYKWHWKAEPHPADVCEHLPRWQTECVAIHSIPDLASHQMLHMLFHWEEAHTTRTWHRVQSTSWPSQCSLRLSWTRFLLWPRQPCGIQGIICEGW